MASFWLHQVSQEAQMSSSQLWSALVAISAAKIVTKRNSSCLLAQEAPGFLPLSKQPLLKPRYQGTRFRNMRSNRCEVQKSVSVPREHPVTCHIEGCFLCPCGREHGPVSHLRWWAQKGSPFVGFSYFPVYSGPVLLWILTWGCFQLRKVLFHGSLYSHNAACFRVALGYVYNICGGRPPKAVYSPTSTEHNNYLESVLASNIDAKQANAQLSICNDLALKKWCCKWSLPM